MVFITVGIAIYGGISVGWNGARGVDGCSEHAPGRIMKLDGFICSRRGKVGF